MAYEYRFYSPGTIDDVGAVVHTETPLPGIATGQYLLLESGRMSMTAGYHLNIANVETYLHAPGGLVKSVVVHVFTRQRDRKALLEALR